MAERLFTSGDLAAHFRVREWKIRQLLSRGLLEEPARLGGYRLWREQDLPRVRQALEAAGYLPAAEGAHA